MTLETDTPSDRASPDLEPRAIQDALAKAGVDANADEVLARLRGIAAAPPNFDAKATHELIVRNCPAGLANFFDRRIAGLVREFDKSIRPGDPASAGDRIAALRGELAARGLTGFMVPRFDEHQGEYVARRSQRLAWLSGFTGSAGTAVVLADKAALFVDGRYTVQAQAETSDALYRQLNSNDVAPSKWLRKTLRAGDRVGFDPWLHTPDAIKNLSEAAASVGAELVAVETNPIDAVWPDQPPPPIGPVIAHGDKYTGEPSSAKRARLADVILAEGADAAVLTAPDSIAWLLNIRGGDLPHTPVALGFAVLHSDASVDWFLDPRKFTDGVTEHLGNQVRARKPDQLGPALDQLGRAKKTVRLDPAGGVSWFFDRLEAGGAQIRRDTDPCAGPKAAKNETELAGMRACHIRDGAALTRFLRWVTETAPQGGVDELDAARKLETFRAQVPGFRDLSFRTISAAGANAALPHYTVTAHSNTELKPGTLYLIDSGCQYPDGTTDVTRTVAVGTPADEHRDRFTRVLKGHIALSSCRFPEGTSGSQLDAFARRPLWQVGLDYDHGTGHGVGTYLSVHEGPQRISKLPAKAALKPGMIVSNEPGYYQVGDYGIRIENLVEVVEIDDTGETTVLGFRYLTCAPMDLTLVARPLLTDDEAAWLNRYHDWVRDQLTPLLSDDEARWLAWATRPV
jgi:Xaa-Pro aminopeptidase